jgi:hypothetical protein
MVRGYLKIQNGCKTHFLIRLPLERNRNVSAQRPGQRCCWWVCPCLAAVQGLRLFALCTSLVLMATFSPSPAPRRSSRLQTRGNSPTRPQRPLRLAQTSTLNQLVDGTNSVASGMDLDDRASIFTDKSLSRMGSDILFAKTDEMSVSFYANLPLEVKQVLRTSGTVHISDNI